MQNLLNWYWQDKRDLPWRKTKDPYKIWISEVMLQQTQVNTVIPYYERFLGCFPTVEVLAQASEDDVISIWRGLGYYSRARRLKMGAEYVCSHYNGVIPREYGQLLQIPGVGEYTAGAIASIAFNERTLAIDGNVKRVASRLLAWREPVETSVSQRVFREKLEAWQPKKYPGDFNQAVMELGAVICTPRKPKCGECPLSEECEAYHINEVLSFPVKRPKKGPKVVTRITFVLRKEQKVYLQQRPEKGLLARLWEFPGVELDEEGWNNESVWEKLQTLTEEQWLEIYKLAVSDRRYDQSVYLKMKEYIKLSGPVWYTFSHRRWRIYWMIVDLKELSKQGEVNEKPSDYRTGDSHSLNSDWVKVRELKTVSLPVAFDEIVNSLEDSPSE